MERIELSKEMPNASEFEQAVIGVVLLERGAYRKVDHLTEECFYVRAHQLVWRAIQELAKKGKPLDILMVTQQLLTMRVLEQAGGAFYISQLTNKVASSANLEFWAAVIMEKYMLREQILLGGELTKVHGQSNPFEVMDTINEKMAALNSMTSDGDPVSAAEVMDNIINNREKPIYITWNMGDLDHHMSMGPGNIVVVGARPSVGKSSLLMNACMNMAIMGFKILFVSLEMSKEALTAKIASSITGINAERITKGDISEEERQRIADAFVRHGSWIPRIIIDDRASLHMRQVAGIMERAVKRHGCSAAVIDYIQLIEGEGDNPVERMSQISKACKRAARSSGIRLIELSQLKRRDGNDVNPDMSDLRESGQLEADGDIIMLLGREPGSHELLVKVAKNKVGPIGSLKIPFNLQTQRIGTFDLTR